MRVHKSLFVRARRGEAARRFLLHSLPARISAALGSEQSPEISCLAPLITLIHEMNNVDATLRRVLTQDEIETAWGASVMKCPRTYFEWEEVPEEVRQLIPYAVFWGASDDWAREDILRNTPEVLKQNLKWVVKKFDDQLDAWLAGPEASNPSPSNAYIAFSAMRMGADFI